MPQRTRVRSPIRRRPGKVLALVVLLLPVLFGIVGLVFDAGMMSADYRSAQHAADAAALAAATDLRLGKDTATAQATASEFVLVHNGLDEATVTTNIPPTSGAFVGNANYVETLVQLPHQAKAIHLLGGGQQYLTTARAVAGTKDATAGAAVVVLDPDPFALSIPAVAGIVVGYPAILGGLEVLGLGAVEVNGAVLVNTEWGGVDENGDDVGEGAGLLRHAISCTPLLGLSALRAEEIRVVGGVDDEDNYAAIDAGPSPLQANRLAVPDPYSDLPVPTTASDSANVSAEEHGGRRIIALPLFPVTLEPGVYDYIEVVTGVVNFEPGVYIIRSTSPVTGLSLNLTAGIIRADGVMFYITDSNAYDGVTGVPDANDGETEPAAPGVLEILPSVVIDALLPTSRFSPLDDPTSPFHDMIIYQRRTDRRPIVIGNLGLLGVPYSGTIYAKWGHVLFIGQGDYDAKFVAGTVRLINVLGLTLTPANLLPPARDVFLVE